MMRLIPGLPQHCAIDRSLDPITGSKLENTTKEQYFVSQEEDSTLLDAVVNRSSIPRPQSLAALAAKDLKAGVSRQNLYANGILTVYTTKPGFWKKTNQLNLRKDTTFIYTKGSGKNEMTRVDNDYDDYNWSDIRDTFVEVQFVGNKPWSASDSAEGVFIYANSKNNLSAFIRGATVAELFPDF